MFGKTEITAIGICSLSAVAAVTDLVSGRIFNWLTAPMLLVGIAVALGYGGYLGLGDSLLGVGVALLGYGWMFRLGAISGGDVKLLMALGAWGGFHFTIEVALLGLVLGGAWALIVLSVKGRLRSFLSRVYESLLSLMLKDLRFQAPKIDHKLTMPFGIPIALAAIWVVIGHPFRKLGIFPWF